MLNPILTRAFVKRILESPIGLRWSVQGLGMMRLYLDDHQVYRLHIWDSSLRVPNVSPIHDHPWHLKSYIVSGQLRQQRFVIDKRPLSQMPSEKLQMTFIKCGEGACTKTEPIDVVGYRQPLETYGPGEVYYQDKSEVHESLALDGTITIVERTFEGDRDTARVFWHGEGGWVDAAPRPATNAEVLDVTRRALVGF